MGNRVPEIYGREDGPKLTAHEILAEHVTNVSPVTRTAIQRALEEHRALLAQLAGSVPAAAVLQSAVVIGDGEGGGNGACVPGDTRTRKFAENETAILEALEGMRQSMDIFRLHAESISDRFFKMVNLVSDSLDVLEQLQEKESK